MPQSKTNSVAKIAFSKAEVEALNRLYRPLSASDRIAKLYREFNEEQVMLTSSFAATSAFLLKLVSDINSNQKVHFIDTGYHFHETLLYKKQLADTYNLNVVSVSALKEEHEFTTKDKTWTKNPDFCCSINKVNPMHRIKKKYSIWISGLMKWQSDHRATLDIFEIRGDVLKFYPLLDVTKDERDKFIKEFDLPFHPLVAKGYNSIGCKHCTLPGKDRSGRWNNNPKTECGLHL